MFRRKRRPRYFYFLPVVFFEPLQRVVRRSLRRTAQTEMEHAHRMMGGILDVARLGDSQKLNAFVEKWIAEQLQLAEVELVLDGEQADNIAERGGDNYFRFSSLEKRQDIFR